MEYFLCVILFDMSFAANLLLRQDRSPLAPSNPGPGAPISRTAPAANPHIERGSSLPPSLSIQGMGSVHLRPSCILCVPRPPNGSTSGQIGTGAAAPSRNTSPTAHNAFRSPACTPLPAGTSVRPRTPASVGLSSNHPDTMAAVLSLWRIPVPAGRLHGARSGRASPCSSRFLTADSSHRMEPRVSPLR